MRDFVCMSPSTPNAAPRACPRRSLCAPVAPARAAAWVLCGRRGCGRVWLAQGCAGALRAPFSRPHADHTLARTLTHTRAHTLALFVHAACMVYVHPRSTEKSFVLLDKASGGVPASSISDELAELALARQNAAKGAFLEAQFLLTCLRCHAAPARAPRRVPHATPPPVRTCLRQGSAWACGRACVAAGACGWRRAVRGPCARPFHARTPLPHALFTHTRAHVPFPDRRQCWP